MAFSRLLTSSLVCYCFVAAYFHAVVLEFLQINKEHLAGGHPRLTLTFPQIPLVIRNGLSCRGKLVVPGTARQQQCCDKNDSFRQVFSQVDFSNSVLRLIAIHLSRSLSSNLPSLYPSFVTKERP